MSLLAAALRQLRAGRGRTVLSAVGLLLAGGMAGAAVTVAYGLGTGFDRSVARSDLPDVVARFAPQPKEKIDALVQALPNVAARSYRVEFDRVPIAANGQSTRRGSLQLVDGTARRGYAVVAGRDLRPGTEDLLVEQGLADAWDLHVGDQLDMFRDPRPITGIAVAPDNVAFPLASAPRVYVDLSDVERRFGEGRRFRVDQALIWTKDPARTDITLQQARATTASIKDLRFITVSGVRVLIDQAAGIVIALLGAFSLIALGAAGIMLASQAASDVQRRLASIGVQRAIGVPRGRVAAEHALAAGLLGLGAGGVGVIAGALAVGGPSEDLLRTLNELGPGAALLLPLAGVVVAITALAALAAATPAWRAAGRQPVALLRGAELRGPARRLGGRPIFGAGPFVLGARLVLARRGRASLAVAVLAASGAVVLLMLGLASLVVGLRDDPGSVGKRYALTVRLPPDQVPAVRALAGVSDAAPRYVVQGADSFSLGEPVKLVALPGDHTRFENPPVAEGRRLRGPGEAEIGLGLASALGIAPGGVLAVQLPGGGQASFRVVGTVRALDTDGRVAYVQPPRVLAAEPGLQPEVVVRLERGADRDAVAAELRGLGARPATVGGATTRSGAFLDTLASLLRVVAVLNALVCLYALLQALGLVARERRPTLALLRATGASAGTIRLVLLGAALALALPAALVAVAVEHWVLAPLTGQLAASYADLAGGATGPQAAAVVLAFVLLAALAALRVAARVVREPPVAGLREE